MTKILSTGKYRALQRSTTPAGHFAILAIDHQDSLRRAMKPDNPQSLTLEELAAFKTQVVQALMPEASGVLLDPVYGAPRAIQHNILQSGLLVELERADYQMEPLPLKVEIDDDWSVAKIRRMGADGVKLFFYYNPANADHAAYQDEIVKQVAADCDRYDIPLYAEPIVYEAVSKTETVIASAQRTQANGADVLKLEFPVDVHQEKDEKVWMQACRQLSAAVRVPRVLLSAGVDFATFAKQLRIDCEAGASGFIGGRAVWGDAAAIADEQEREDWLQNTGRARMQELAEIVAAYARPWQDFYRLPELSPDWFRNYEAF